MMKLFKEQYSTGTGPSAHQASACRLTTPFETNHLNVNKAKEIIINFRKHSGGHAPVYVNGAEAEMVESFKFLGVQITNHLSLVPPH